MTAEAETGSPPGFSEAAAAPHYVGHRERLRQRFRDAGGSALADYELLELVLFRAIPRQDVKGLAKDLLRRFGSFAEVIAASPQRLAEVKGVRDAVVTEIKIVEAATQRALRGEIAGRQVLGSWAKVLEYCRATMAFSEREQFRILFLDKKNALIAEEVQQTGTVDHTPVYPAKWCAGRSNCRPPPSSSSTTIPLSTRRALPVTHDPGHQDVANFQ